MGDITQEWLDISGAVEGLRSAWRDYHQQIRGGGSDSFALSEQLFSPVAIQCFRNLVQLLRDNVAKLPPHAREVLEWTSQQEPLLKPSGGGQRTAALVAMVAALKTEVENLLRAPDVRAVPIIERAFLHLQRSIVVDPSVQQAWHKAFRQGEVFCEALGALHLLQHGIWAFKAHAHGARTDLILNQPVTEADATGVAAYLLLTEWKLVREGDDPESKVREALRQAQEYGDGVLGGVELTTHRYLILVSQAQLQRLPDRMEGKVLYRVANVAIRPTTPSKTGRRLSAATPGFRRRGQRGA